MSQKICVAYWGLKEAALYFDIVFPYSPRALLAEIRPHINSFPYALPGSLFKSGVYDSFERELHSLIPFLNISNVESIEHFLERAHSLYVVEEAFNQFERDRMHSFISILDEILNNKEYIKIDTRIFGVHSWKQLHQERFIETIGRPHFHALLSYKNAILEVFYRFVNEALKSIPNRDLEISSLLLPPRLGANPIDSPAVLLHKIHLIDVKEISWEKIINLRKDEIAIKKLRNLRLFLTTEYIDKQRDAEFVKDDLERRIEEYYDVVKEYSLQTKEGQIEAFLQGAFATSTTIAAAIVNGEKWQSILAAFGSASLIETVRGSFSIRKSKRSYTGFEQGNPLAYLIQLKEDFSSPKQNPQG